MKGECNMALINCPECGKEISDKAKMCIHCGFPLDDLQTAICDNEDFANEEEKQRLIERAYKEISADPQKEKQFYEQRYKNLNSSNIVKCPKCGSTQIQMVQRKWTPIMGIFTNKVDRVCMNCKHKF